MRLLQNKTSAVIIDIQERLFPHIHEHELLEKKCQILISGLQILSIPITVTQQYTRGLGETIRPLKELLAESEPLEKMTFSCCGIDSFSDRLKSMNRKNVILAGIETHVCVLQTALDLIEQGYQPVLVEDCVSSRNQNDKAQAVARMRSEGVIITTLESVLFELCRVSGTEEFKAISRLVK